jgi:hypothetical protein
MRKEPTRPDLEGKLRGHIEAANRRDDAAALAIFSEGAVWDRSPVGREVTGVAVSKENLVAFLAGMQAINRGGVETDISTADGACFRDGEMGTWKGFGDRDEALNAAGLEW